MNRNRLARSTADLAAWLRYQKRLGVTGAVLTPAALAALDRLENPRAAAPPPSPGQPNSSDPTAAEGDAPTETLADLADRAGKCRRCGLAEGRQNVVFGEGHPRAELMFIGEGPGADEDRTGRPFVGRAGEKLTDIITKGMGLSREQVYIGNIVKCRPPGNRDPKPDERDACRPWLDAQIGLIKPKVIVALGKVAAQYLLDDDTPISRLRGKWRDYRGIPLMPTFHPSYLLRNPTVEVRRQVWEDIKQVMAELGLQPPGS